MKTIVDSKGFEHLVDDEDYERVSAISWSAHGAGYAHNERVGLLHRFIIGARPEGVVDHINRNVKDCRRANLRDADKRVNSINRGLQANNTSGIRGVAFNKRRGKWIAYIKNHGKRTNLGYFAAIEDATAARIAAEQRMFA